MNQLPLEKRVQIIRMLVEGMSMRSISRTVDVSINTVSKILVDSGKACAEYRNHTVRNVETRRVECDEIWSFCYAKQKNVARAKAAPEGAGDIWTWTAIDADSRMILSYIVGDRSYHTAIPFIKDLKNRITDRVQINTDGLPAYLEAIDETFGADVDYAQLIKMYGKDSDDEDKRYSPAKCTGIIKRNVLGNPDMEELSTSYVERQNLSMRMGMRRFTRLTNAFSKKLENHFHMLSIYFVFYNFVKDHKTLRCTPAMEAGIANEAHDIEWMVGLIDAKQKKSNRSKSYMKKVA